MSLVKTSALNSISVIAKILTLLGVNKVLAMYIGPSGYAALGQFQNAIQMLTTFASGAINTGVIKYTAEYCNDEIRQRLVWRTAGTIALVGSFATSIILICFNEYLATFFLQDTKLGSVFVWFAFALLPFVFNSLLSAILNGRKEVKRLVVANILGNIFSLLVTSMMAIQFGIYGALVALATYQSLSFFVTLFICLRTKWFKLCYLVGSIDKDVVINLSKYTLMALTSAACVPLSNMIIRDFLGKKLGWEAAGYWEAMWRLSGACLMLATTTLSVYYLPRLSELKKIIEIKTEILHGYRVLVPFTGISCFLIYLLRDSIIQLLFSEGFSPMRELFAWQMIGDFFKITSYVLAFLMLSKAMTRLFIITEILFSAFFVCLVWFLVPIYGLVGVSIAHAINYFCYFIAIFISLNSYWPEVHLIRGK